MGVRRRVWGCGRVGRGIRYGGAISWGSIGLTFLVQMRRYLRHRIRHPGSLLFQISHTAKSFLHDKLETVQTALGRLVDLPRPRIDLVGIVAYDPKIAEDKVAVFLNEIDGLSEIGNGSLDHLNPSCESIDGGDSSMHYRPCHPDPVLPLRRSLTFVSPASRLSSFLSTFTTGLGRSRGHDHLVCLFVELNEDQPQARSR